MSHEAKMGSRKEYILTCPLKPSAPPPGLIGHIFKQKYIVLSLQFRKFQFNVATFPLKRKQISEPQASNGMQEQERGGEEKLECYSHQTYRPSDEAGPRGAFAPKKL